jgi:cytochrome c553
MKLFSPDSLDAFAALDALDAFDVPATPAVLTALTALVFQPVARKAGPPRCPSPAQRERGRGEGRSWPAAWAAAATVSLCSLAQAQDAPAAANLPQRALAATCAACHGTEGRAPAGSAIPALAGRPAPWLTEQMQAFKTGKREATVMHQIARGYSDAQIQQLAAFFAAQKP